MTRTESMTFTEQEINEMVALWCDEARVDRPKVTFNYILYTCDDKNEKSFTFYKIMEKESSNESNTK